MAAHLHDSVLQTLALIQKQADDPRAVARRLARSQERELRSWLYDEDDNADQTLSGAAKRAAAEVEDSHGVPVEVVTVGDCELTEPLSSMVRAARESMVNAAKHSGAAKIDVFVEVDGDRAEIFVRDRGKGFDVDGVPDDRLGLRHSVMGQNGTARRPRNGAADPEDGNRSATGDGQMSAEARCRHRRPRHVPGRSAQRDRHRGRDRRRGIRRRLRGEGDRRNRAGRRAARRRTCPAAVAPR